MTERKDGYYWVRKTNFEFERWSIGLWNCGVWLIAGMSCSVKESEISEINETRIPSPDEKCIEIPNDNTSRTIPINMERPIEKSFFDMMENNHNQ